MRKTPWHCSFAIRVIKSGQSSILGHDRHETAPTGSQVGKAMDEGQVPLADYVITKGMTKMPHEYPDGAVQAHVQVRPLCFKQFLL